MKPTPSPPPEHPVRPHVYDGIQEYDAKLPNWWLYTLYITILFWVGYWGYYEWFQMSLNATFVTAGKAVYDSNCAACHLASLRGKTESVAAIGPDLTDTRWVYGGNPVEIYDLIAKGVLAKGMPTWGPVLGPKKISEVTAYILSKHKEGEPILREPQPGSVAGQ
jgi:cytochrome c oxidase cbb3-type subunit 3